MTVSHQQLPLLHALMNGKSFGRAAAALVEADGWVEGLSERYTL